MAELTLRLLRDPTTGRRTIVVKLDSDPDATPLEHERQHRQLVENLIEGGIIRADEADQITIDRATADAGRESPALSNREPMPPNVEETHGTQGESG